MPRSDSDTHLFAIKANICRDALLSSLRVPTTLNLRVSFGSSRDPMIPNSPSELVELLKLKHASSPDIILNPASISLAFKNIEFKYNVKSYKQAEEVVNHQLVECMWSNIRVQVTIGRYEKCEFSSCKGLADLIKSDIKSSSVYVKGTPDDDYSIIKVWLPITAIQTLAKLYRITLKPNKVCMRVVPESQFIYNLFNSELDISSLSTDSSLPSSSSSSSSSYPDPFISSMQQTCTNCWTLTSNIQLHKQSPCLRKCPLCNGYCDKGHCQHQATDQYVCRICRKNHKTIACYQLHWSFNLREHHLKLLADNLALLKPSSPFSNISSSYVAAFEKTSSLEHSYKELAEKFKKLCSKTEVLEDTIADLRRYILSNLSQDKTNPFPSSSLPSRTPPPLLPPSRSHSPDLLPNVNSLYSSSSTSSSSSSSSSPSTSSSSSSSPSTSSSASSQSASSIDIPASSSSRSSSSKKSVVISDYNFRDIPQRKGSPFSFKFPETDKSSLTKTKNRS